MIDLRCSSLTLALLPELGGSIAHFRDGETSLLRETPPDAITRRDGRAFAAFPLIPFSNRIRAGAFNFAGQHYVLDRDAEDPRHALHGTARFKPWQVQHATATTARCTLDYTPQPGDWPFSYTAWQEFTLAENRLTITLGLRNQHHSPAPAGIGWHPYFERHGLSLLQFDAAYVWLKDAQDIPIGTTPDAGKFDFTQPRPIELEDLIDHAYGGWDKTATIAYPNDGRQIQINAGPTFKNLVLYTPEDKDFFAVEPVSHRPDALNPNGDAHDESMTILAPGGMLEGKIEVLVQKKAVLL